MEVKTNQFAYKVPTDTQHKKQSRRKCQAFTAFNLVPLCLVVCHSNIIKQNVFFPVS